VAGKIVLAIDNSLDYLNLALGKDGNLIEERHGRFAQPTSEVLSLKVRTFLSDQGYRVQDLNALAVTLGPGSFTGIRVALAFCKGLSQGLGLDLVGVPTLDTLAHPFCHLDGYHLVPLVDAKKGEVFAATYRASGGRLERTSDYQAVKPAHVVCMVNQPCLVFGTGLRLCEDFLREHPGLILVREAFSRIQGEALLRLGTDAYSTGERIPVEPIYCRKSEAEIKFNVTIS
jgi:tRNA threonylcarbamoyladenosine biosynthesis protein TsaB